MTLLSMLIVRVSIMNKTKKPKTSQGKERSHRSRVLSQALTPVLARKNPMHTSNRCRSPLHSAPLKQEGSFFRIKVWIPTWCRVSSKSNSWPAKMWSRTRKTRRAWACFRQLFSERSRSIRPRQISSTSPSPRYTSRKLRKSARRRGKKRWRSLSNNWLPRVKSISEVKNSNLRTSQSTFSASDIQLIRIHSSRSRKFRGAAKRS